MEQLPQIPLHDILVGLTSSVLLVIAAYLLVRPKTWLTYRDHAQRFNAPLPSLFLEVGTDRSARRLSLVGSLFLHLLGISLIPLLELVFPGPLPFQAPRYQAITLEYHIPLPPLVAPDELELLEEKKPETDQREYPDGDSTNPALAKDDARRQPEPAAGTESGESPANPEIQVEQAVSAEAESAGEPQRVLAKEVDSAQGSEADDEASTTADSPASGQSQVAEASEPEIELSPPEVIKLLLPNVIQVNPALKDIVLQPDFTVKIPDEQVLNTPPVLLWNPEPPALPETAVLKPGPGDGDSPSEMNLADVQPQIQPPNLRPEVVDLQMNEVMSSILEPALPVPTGDSVPLAGRKDPEQASTETPSISGADGEYSLMVFSQNPDIRDSTFRLTPGLRLGSIDTEPGYMPEGVVGGTGSVEDTGVRPADPDRPSGSGDGPPGGDRGDTEVEGEGVKAIRIYRGNTGSGSGSVQVVRVGSGPRRSLLAENRSGSGTHTGGSGGPGSSTEGKGPVGQPDGSTGGEGRLKPLPRAQYGIILVSNARSALPEAAEFLTGSPIYTVYLKVPRAQRKWVLQYCLPGSASQGIEISGNVVKVRSRRRLDPPFPIHQEPIDLDPALSREKTPPRVVVYGTFDDEGEIDNLRVIRGADSETERTILAALLSWDYLPAFQGEIPVPVEVLFGIPLR